VAGAPAFPNAHLHRNLCEYSRSVFADFEAAIALDHRERTAGILPMLDGNQPYRILIRRLPLNIRASE
jgi:hypothetical protein